MSKADNAKQLFLQGYNCAQAITGAFYEDMALDFDTAVKFGSAFGGGLGRMREVCGAISGISMVLSAKYGYTDISDKFLKTELYSTVQNLAEKFRNQNGSIICRELLSGHISTSPVPDDRTPEYYKTRSCADKVYDAAKILEDFISEKNE